MTYISKYISYEEATVTTTELPNVPDAKQVAAMQLVAQKVFDKVREYVKVPIGISSFFRSDKVNRAVGGAHTSQHRYGEAIDIDAQILGGTTNAEIFHFIKDNCDFDQLIWEQGTSEEPAWVHVSYKVGLMRRQVLKAVKQGGKTVYIPYR